MVAVSRTHSYAIHALAVWAEVQSQARELGWPAESSEVRAFRAAQAASVGSGRDNSVRQGVGIPVCRETRQARGSSIPRLHRHRLADEVDRHLRDMDASRGGFRAASVLRATAQAPRTPSGEVARSLGMSSRTLFRLRRAGLERLSVALSQTARK